jgi:cytochrome c-type biogenesis protein CcmH
MIRAALIALIMLATPAMAVQPDEMLADPELEARARAISAELRCLVCQNQSIDDSDAPLARDLRILVRERLKAGDSDAEVRTFLVDRYGEFVLLKPTFSGRNLFLWLTPLLALVLGAAVAIRRFRARSSAPGASLSPEEEQALAKILKRDSQPPAGARRTNS